MEVAAALGGVALLGGDLGMAAGLDGVAGDLRASWAARAAARGARGRFGGAKKWNPRAGADRVDWTTLIALWLGATSWREGALAGVCAIKSFELWKNRKNTLNDPIKDKRDHVPLMGGPCVVLYIRLCNIYK